MFVLFGFVLYLWDPPNQNASNCALGFFGKLLRRRGASTWFHGIWTCGAKVLEYWMISSLKIKLNCSWKCQRNWNVPLVLLERSWWTRVNGFYLVRFGFIFWEFLISKWVLPLKIKINSKKSKFWKENLVEDMITLGPMAHATLVYIRGSMSIFIIYIGIIGPLFCFHYTNFKVSLVVKIIIFKMPHLVMLVIFHMNVITCQIFNLPLFFASLPKKTHFLKWKISN